MIIPATGKNASSNVLEEVNDRAIAVPWRPTEAGVNVVSKIINTAISVQASQAQPTVAAANPSGTGGVPETLLSISVAQSPIKQQTYTDSQITVNFTWDASDKNYDHVNIWVKGYHGNVNPVLVASAASSPVNVILDSTGETVTVYGQTVSASGQSAAVSYALSAPIALSGVVTNPPAPTISQTLTSTPLGIQFSFNQVNLSGTQDVITAYRVYKNSSNSFSGSTLFQTFAHDPTHLGAIVVQDTIGGGQTNYYWVTSVNSIGLESTATAAQSSAVATGLATSASVTPVNNAGISTSSSAILTQSGTTKTINVAAFTVQYAKGQVSYNSGSVTPSVYGTFAVFLNDPTFAGGSVTFTATQQGFVSVAGDGYCCIGTITTAAGGGGTGGGGGGSSNGQICFSPDTLVKTKRGVVRIDEIEVGDEVLTALGTWRPILGVLSTQYEGLVVPVGCGLATPGHHFFIEEGKWEKAGSLSDLRSEYKGKVMNLIVAATDFDEHSYMLENGMIAHNIMCA
jgi:hypothetical protein